MTKPIIPGAPLGTKCLVAAVGVLAITAVAARQVDAAPQQWTCNCTISPDEIGGACECTGYRYDIARSGTKQFRGFCAFKSNSDEVVEVRQGIHVVEKAKDVTCTIATFGVPYSSRSSVAPNSPT